MVSPDGTTIPPPQGLIDAAGHVWTLVGGGVRVDGEWAGFAIADVAQLAIYRGVVYVQQVGGTWWWRAAATGSWRPVSTTSLKVSTWLISGQSNAVGVAVADGGEIAPSPRVVAWDGDAAWPIASEPLPFVEALAPPYQHGSWLAAAQAALARSQEIRLTGYAKGSQIIVNWHADQPCWTKLAAAIAAAGSIDVFLWHQGESDADSPSLVAAYPANLADLIARVRALTWAALPVIVIGVGPYVGAGTDYAGIRSAQQAVAATVPGVTYVSTLDLPFADGGEHLTAAGYRALGQRIAAVLR